MTIAPTEFDGAIDDAQLATAAARGDRAAFAAIYDRYANRLYDFCAGMLRDTDAAADCVQDVFVDAATQLGALRDPSRLRPWLYAIARNQALARIRARRREMPTDELPEVDSGEPDLATLAARSELATLISDACGGLSERDRTIFELTYRHGLDGTELADALGVSHTNANTRAGRLRDGVERSLGALLVCRGVKTDPACCPELALLLDDWDGTFTVLMRKRAARHIDRCSVCEEERRRRVNPVALLGGVPVFLPAPGSLREPTLAAAAKRLPEDVPTEATPPPPARTVSRLSPAQGRHARAALIAMFVILGIAGVAQLSAPLLLRDQRVDPVSEVDAATTEAPGSKALTGPASLAPSLPPTTAAPSEPVQGPTTTVITTALTTTAPARATTQTPTTTSTKPNNSFTPSRSTSSTERTTETSTRTRTSTSSSTMTSTSTSTSPPPTTTTTTSDPIE
jgi:RNA polymerase sigma factor (sigma-70 family)